MGDPRGPSPSVVLRRRVIPVVVVLAVAAGLWLLLFRSDDEEPAGAPAPEPARTSGPVAELAARLTARGARRPGALARLRGHRRLGPVPRQGTRPPARWRPHRSGELARLGHGHGAGRRHPGRRAGGRPDPAADRRRRRRAGRTARWPTCRPRRPSSRSATRAPRRLRRTGRPVPPRRWPRPGSTSTSRRSRTSPRSTRRSPTAPSPTTRRRPRSSPPRPSAAAAPWESPVRSYISPASGPPPRTRAAGRRPSGSIRRRSRPATWCRSRPRSRSGSRPWCCRSLSTPPMTRSPRGRWPNRSPPDCCATSSASRGVAITDDLGAGAVRAGQGVDAAAVDALAAGADLVQIGSPTDQAGVRKRILEALESRELPRGDCARPQRGCSSSSATRA